MAITDAKKVDYLWKKIGYGATKTDTNAIKKAPNEAIASPLLLNGANTWNEANLIPATLPASSAGVVEVYPTSNPIETTADGTATANRTWKTGEIDWIPPEIGSTYQVKVYIHTSSDAGNAAASGDQVFATGSGNDDEWFFDYQSGVLPFIGTNLPNGINFTGKSVYIAGGRYTGQKGLHNISGGNGIVISADDSSGVAIADGGAVYIQGGTNVTTSANSDGTITINATGGSGNGFTIGDTASNEIDIADGGNLDVKGTNGIDVSVAGSTLTIDGSNVGGTLSIFGDDSTNMEVSLSNDDLQVSGGNSITTSTSSTQTLTIELDGDIAVNNINALDSSGVNVNTNLYVNGASVITQGGNISDLNNDSNFLTDISISIVGDDSATHAITNNGQIQFSGGTNITTSTSSEGTVTVDLDDTVSLAGDLTVSGNLTVSGTTTYIETTNTKISDPLLLLNNGNSGGSDIDAGIMIERGSAGNNAVFYWNEGDDVFKAVTTTSGEDATAITDTALANIRAADPSNAQDVATKNYVDTQNPQNFITGLKFGDTTSTEITVSDTVNLKGTGNIDVTVSGDTITIDGSNISGGGGNGFTVSADDSAGVEIADGGAVYIQGGTNVTTSANSDGTVTINGIADASELELGTPTDSSTFPVGAISTLTPTHTVADSIDDLNEALENVRNNTFVKSVSFVADQTSGGAGLVVTLTITAVGNANAFDVTWGDGNTDIGTTDTTPTHTYSSNTDSPFTVVVRAYNTGGQGTGSEATSTRTDYITIYTANPVPSFEFYAAASGGTAITGADLGSTVYLENTTTNTTGATATFTIDWGDGVTEQIAANGDAGGVDGARLSHVYDRPDAGDSSTTLVGDGDLRFTPRLTLVTHNTADPSVIPVSTSNQRFYVYADHVPELSVGGSTIRGINEEADSGFSVTFTNDTATRPGAFSTFNTDSGSQTYVYDFGNEDSTVTTVNIGSGSAGDTGQNITQVFQLASADQTGGNTRTFTTVLTLNNGSSNSPFTTDLNIIVEPDVRANISATADTVSDKTGDTALDLYDFTDLSGNNRASVTFTNTSQNNDDNEYDFFNDSSDVNTVPEDGSSAGSTSATLTKDFSGTSVGNFTTDFKVTGTPDTIHQTDSETITFTMNANPAQPDSLSAKSLTLADSAQFVESPKLAANAADNTSSFTSLSAGDSLNTTTVRRYTSGTIDTNVVDNAYTGASGTVTASINASADGSKTFSTATGENGTFTSLVVSNQDDAHDTISASTYPSDFYQTFDAKITKLLSGYSVGVNAQRLEHDETGNTNLVYVVRDDVTSTPTTTIGTVSENSAGTLRYVSGLPYYNTGSPSLTVTGTTIEDLTGIAYADITDPHEVDAGTVTEGSGGVITNTNYTYANIDGSPTFLSSGVPLTDTGVSSAYTIGAVNVNVTTSSVFSRGKVKARSTNVNGTGSYSESNTIVSVFTATPSGLNNENGGIVVSDSLGSGFDDDAVRIYSPDAFYSTDSSTVIGDTPNFNGATNFYTTHTWAGDATDVVAGTDEAIILPSSASAGVVSYVNTDYSSGYLPAGPDLSTQPRGDSSNPQYFTIAFRRTVMANFTLTITGKVRGVFIAAPGTGIDTSSTLNGWLDASVTYGGSGQPGADTGNGGNGSNGCAFTSGDRIQEGVSYSNQGFTLTLGTENATNATGNNVLIRFKLIDGDSISAISIA